MYNEMGGKLYFSFLKKEIYFRLPAVATGRGCSGIESGHSFRHGGYIFVPVGTGIRHGKIEDLH